jgi:hypothetical protein
MIRRLGDVPGNVTVALVGDPANPGARIEPEEWEKPWDERPKIQLELDEGETLGSLVERSLESFGVDTTDRDLAPVHIVDLAVYQGETLTRPVYVDFTLVDEHGTAVWSIHDLRLIPYEQVVRSVEAGALVGDPERFYLVLSEPIGDGIGIDWPTLVQAWDLVWAIAEHVAAAAGAGWALKAVVDRVRGRLKGGRDALDRNVHRWAQRGAWPSHFARFLRRETWSSETLAGLLDCSPADAEAILALFGFSFEEADGLWHRDGDEAARILGAAYDEAAMARIDLSEGDRERFEARARELLETGQAPPEPIYELEEEEPEFFELVSFAITSEAIAGQLNIGGRQIQIQIPIEDLDAQQAPNLGVLFEAAYSILQAEVIRLGRDAGEPADETDEQESE